MTIKPTLTGRLIEYVRESLLYTSVHIVDHGPWTMSENPYFIYECTHCRPWTMDHVLFAVYVPYHYLSLDIRLVTYTLQFVRSTLESYVDVYTFPIYVLACVCACVLVCV
jgi:hypothetical protein